MPDLDVSPARLPDAPYAFRPAKRIQRLMFCDALRTLRSLRAMDDYQYVGLGHWQFVDFELMRREVGVRRMYSMDHNTNDRARFEENLPFDEIGLLFGAAGDCLQDESIDLSRPTIAWLDYTAKLDSTVLQDLRLLVEQVPVGSVVAATFNCHPDREDQRVDALERKVGEVPGDVTEEDLGHDGLPKVQRRIVVEQLDATAQNRGDGALICQFMFLRYVDRSPMVFWAGLVADESDPMENVMAALGRHEQFRGGEEFLDVSVPLLTTREVIALNKDIREGHQPSIRGVPRDECEAYGRLHRWYPPVPLPL
jgi:hypothetical protein